MQTEKEQIQNQIQELQEKLKKLEEKEPEMMLLRQGKVDFVDYKKNTYMRIEYTDSFSGVYKWYQLEKFHQNLIPIKHQDLVYPLEKFYQEEVVKQKDDYPYKKYTPEETEQSLKEAFREAVRQGVVSSTKSPTLYDICVEWNDDDDNPPVSDLIDAIEQWLPKEQSAEGSQNAYVESAVEGFNDCLQQIKSKLR
jgi:hypothetical protein